MSVFPYTVGEGNVINAPLTTSTPETNSTPKTNSGFSIPSDVSDTIAALALNSPPLKEVLNQVPFAKDIIDMAVNYETPAATATTAGLKALGYGINEIANGIPVAPAVVDMAGDFISGRDVNVGASVTGGLAGYWGALIGSPLGPWGSLAIGGLADYFVGEDLKNGWSGDFFNNRDREKELDAVEGDKGFFGNDKYSPSDTKEMSKYDKDMKSIGMSDMDETPYGLSSHYEGTNADKFEKAADAAIFGGSQDTTIEQAADKAFSLESAWGDMMKDFDFGDDSEDDDEDTTGEDDGGFGSADF